MLPELATAAIENRNLVLEPSRYSTAYSGSADEAKPAWLSQMDLAKIRLKGLLRKISEFVASSIVLARVPVGPGPPTSGYRPDNTKELRG
jgi:hypothetical protein